jgi:hypothetical protein
MRTGACVAVACSVSFVALGCGSGDDAGAQSTAAPPAVDAGDPAAPAAPPPAPAGAPASPAGGDAVPAPAGGGPIPGTSAPGLRVWFGVDPALSGGAGTERWVSPATFTWVDDAAEATVALRVQLVDRELQGRDVSATWASSDDGAVAVSEPRGHQVTLRIARTGLSTLRVEHASGLAVLVVRAVHDGNAWRVDVTQ